MSRELTEANFEQWRQFAEREPAAAQEIYDGFTELTDEQGLSIEEKIGGFALINLVTKVVENVNHQKNSLEEWLGQPFAEA